VTSFEDQASVNPCTRHHCGTLLEYSKPGVPNLGYMYPQGCIFLSEGVHLRLAIEEKIYLQIVYFQIFIHISANIIFKNHYMFIVKYIRE